MLLNNFKGDLEKVKVGDNKYEDVTSRVVFGSFPNYGAKSKGWKGWADISSLIK
ncbi:hypothetical protein D3C80_2223050 [compost metagenome]